MWIYTAAMDQAKGIRIFKRYVEKCQHAMIAAIERSGFRRYAGAFRVPAPAGEGISWRWEQDGRGLVAHR